MAPPPPPLMEELVEEILLRFPPGEPALLIRAALVCKKWRRLVSGAAFCRRFREFHRTAPMLGFFCNLRRDHTAQFVPASSSCPPHAISSSFALDGRHGRVLLYSVSTPPHGALAPSALDYHFVVWDPAMDSQRPLPTLHWFRQSPDTWSAAVLCRRCATATGDGGNNACDHRDCAFLVVVAFVRDKAYIHVYSSEAGRWDKPAVGDRPSSKPYAVMGPSLLIGDRLHFAIEGGRRILTYDLGRRVVSVITTPPVKNTQGVGNMSLVTAEDGGLGLAGIKDYNLYLWSWRIDPDSGVGGWNMDRVIDLEMVVSISMGIRPAYYRVVGFAEGADTIFIVGYDGIFTVSLRSGQIRKVRSKGSVYGIVPYMSFYTPDQA